MKITQFKEMLAIHGADFSRWDGVDEAEAKAFMESSDQAKKFYNEASMLDAALDRFEVEEASPVLLDRVMGRIGGEQDQGSAEIHKLDPQRKKAEKTKSFSRPFAWGGAMAAMAAAVVIYVSMPVPELVQKPTIDNQVVLAEVDAFVEEELERQELMELWQLASARVEEQHEEIDTFLNELFEEPAEEKENKYFGPYQEPGLWDIFLEIETQEL